MRSTSTTAGIAMSLPLARLTKELERSWEYTGRQCLGAGVELGGSKCAQRAGGRAQAARVKLHGKNDLVGRSIRARALERTTHETLRGERHWKALGDRTVDDRHQGRSRPRINTPVQLCQLRLTTPGSRNAQRHGQHQGTAVSHDPPAKRFRYRVLAIDVEHAIGAGSTILHVRRETALIRKLSLRRRRLYAV